VFVSRRTPLAITLALASLLAGCHKGAPPTAEQPAFTKIDPATAGSVTGTISFKGDAPSQIPIDTSQDPACALSDPKQFSSEQYLVQHGDLANVYIYIQSGLSDRVYAAPVTPVVLNQKGCRYIPHVLAVMAGQPIEVHTSDMTMHNVHPEPTLPANHESDITQAPMGQPVTMRFPQPETMISVRCNNHPWMEAFINVAPNPFFAVSDGDGHYQIQGLPPGTYKLAAVHEKLGEKDTTITVAAHAATTANFAFEAK
jgi:plastocyanin